MVSDAPLTWPDSKEESVQEEKWKRVEKGAMETYEKWVEESEETPAQGNSYSESGPGIINPQYYASKKIEPIAVIEDWDLGHHLACCVKYISRFKLKGDQSDAVDDLKKAVWYINRKIEIESNKI
jgi:hypothetical protein